MILANGFEGYTGTYLAGTKYTGVCLSNWPLDIADRMPLGESLLKVTLAIAEYELAFYEWVDQGYESYCEWLVPAALIEVRGKVEIVTVMRRMRHNERQ